MRRGRVAAAGWLSWMVLGLVSALLPDVSSAASPTALDALSDRFEVFELVDGMGLRPIEAHDVRLFEIRDGRVAADGKVVDAEGLAALVGEEDARLILQLVASEAPALKPSARDPGPARDEPVAASRRTTTRSRSRFSFGSGVTVGPRESTEDVIVLFGSVVVRGEVRGTVLALGGRVEIDGGEVTDSVAAVGGSVRLRGGARVGGDVVSVGGSVSQTSDSRVRGAVTEIASGGVPSLPGWPRWLRPGWWTPWTGFGDRIGTLVLLLVGSLLVVFAAQRGTGSVADRVVNEPIKSGVVGMVVQVLAIPVMVFMTVTLAVSIVGIPLLLLVPLTAVALAVALLVGYASSALVVGRALLFHGRAKQPVGTAGLVATGVVLIQGSSMAGALLLGIGGLLGPLGLLLLALGFLAQYLAWTAGFGAVVLQALTPTPKDHDRS